jgi:hypothetical protein
MGSLMARHPVPRSWGGGWAGFGLGLAASVLIDAVGPHLAKAAGPAARSTLKFLFHVSDEVARSTARFREQAEDFVATTRAEYDDEREAVAGENDGAPAKES